MANVLQFGTAEREQMDAVSSRPLHFLHFMPSFNPGGAQVRVADLMNHFAGTVRHTVFAFHGGFAMAERVSPEVALDCKALSLGGGSLGRVRSLMRLIEERKPDLVLTYNWGAVEAAMAAIFSGAAPLVHGEDGFGPEEASLQIPRRVWTRRLILRRAAAVVAPSENLTHIMRDVWKLGGDVVRYIPNGVDIDHFRPRERKAATNEVVVCTVGQLRPEKQQGLLIQACARLSQTVPVRLLVAGDGPERHNLENIAVEAGFRSQVEFLGHVHDPISILQQSDIFALSSMTEQMPISVLEAMACGLPVLSTAVGDVGVMVGAANRPFVCESKEQYQQALAQLAGDRLLRESVGADNRARCVETYSRTGMLENYSNLYAGLAGAQLLQH